jgi:hypothetical protein
LFSIFSENKSITKILGKIKPRLSRGFKINLE